MQESSMTASTAQPRTLIHLSRITPLATPRL
jgi:hypothetical protein